jgi:hypothetical protein
MFDEQGHQETDEDPFAESDEWIAAECRQLFRALTSYDAKAVEVCLFQFAHYLSLTLARHLRSLPRWDINGLWFDRLDGLELHSEAPSRLRMNGWLVCVQRKDEEAEDWWREPTGFDLQLFPNSGRFQGYRFRVGDQQPREEKMVIGLEVGIAKRIELEPFKVVDLPYRAPTPLGNWLDVIVRGQFTGE